MKRQQKDRRARLEFVTRLQALMSEKGINETELARRVDISQSSVNDWLNPKKLAVPFSDVLARLAQVLDVSTDWLLLNRGSRRGGAPPAGEAYADGRRSAITLMRAALDEIEQESRGASASDVAPHFEDEHRRQAPARQRRAQERPA